MGMDATSLHRNAGLIKLYLLLVPGSLVICTAMGYDGSLLNGLQGVDGWVDYFNEPKGALLGIMNAVLPLGAVFGAIPAAWICDRYGRRVALMTGDVIMLVAAALQTASLNVAMYMVSRFLIGIGLTVASTAAPMMVAELAHPNTRTTMTALYNTLWYFGSIVAAWTTYGSWRIDSTWSWRLPTLLQALPACINLVAIWWLPESPRWLVGKDRRQEALDILTKYHGNGDANSPLVAAEFTEICETLQLELTGQRSWSELFRTKANRHRTFLVVCCALFPQWSGNGLISYYIAPILRSIGITSQANITLINGILQIWNMLVAVTGACLVARVGRRPLFLTSTGGMLTVMIAWTISGSVFDKTKSTATGAGILVCVILFATSYNICWNPLAVAYPVEILPFSIRAKGIALLMGATKGATFFNQFVNPIGLAELGWRYYIVYCVWLSVVLTVVYYTFPETKNHTLEDTADIFEKRHLPWSRDKSERSSVVQCVEVRNTSTKAA